MTEQDYNNRQGKSEAQYRSAMICTTISYIGLIVSFILILINKITL